MFESGNKREEVYGKEGGFKLNQNRVNEDTEKFY